MSNSLTAALSGEVSSGPASQATTIEQSRAIAEVQAMVVVAQRNPRHVPSAISNVREACKVHSMASVAFFSLKRGDDIVTGETIKLATELARCWGNINYGLVELSRDDARGVSEMMAFAWDVQTNVRNSTSFIVPHKIDLKGGHARALTTAQSVYENNAGQGARRLREMILRALPSWLVEDAKAICQNTLEKGEGDLPFDKRVARAIETMSNAGISLERLEGKHGKATSWTPVTLAGMTVSLGSINRGEISADDAFPHVQAAIVTNGLASLPAPVVEPPPEAKAPEPVADQMPAPKPPAPVRTAETEDMINRMRQHNSGSIEAAVAKQEDPALVEFTRAKIKQIAKVKSIDELDAMHGGMIREIGHLPQQLAAWNTARIERIKAIMPEAKAESED